ncbi:MAG TPA: phospholipid carrier-dependent glycosyltransferase [Thermoanaerobaculia bacterium]|nr:phospholipid carrier-dependent glycosyltransferase [Thermoanaerobaculia bacterium]
MTGSSGGLEMSWNLLPHTVVHLGAAALYAWLIAALGRRLLRSLGQRGPAEALALDLALGFAVLAQVLFLFGLAGWIEPIPIVALLVLVAVVCARDGLEVARDLGRLLLPRRGHERRSWWWRAIPFALVLAPMLVLALYPPTGFDSLNYHLPFVASFVESGRLVTNETLRFPVFPQLVEVVLTAPSLLVGDTAAEAFLLAPTLAVALLVGAWAVRAGGRSSGPLAAAIWLSSPLVVWMSSQAYVDLTLSLFVVAGLHCVARARDGGHLLRAGSAGRGATWLVLGGIFLGAACGTKYLGLPWAALGAALAWASAGEGRRLRAVLVVGLAAGAVAGPWYARIGLETGNPVFPYLSEVFTPGTDRSTPESGSGSSAAEDTAVARDRRRANPFRGGVTGLLALPVSVTWAREAFDRQAPMTPWALPVFLAVVWRARRDRRLRWVLLATAAYGLTLLVQSRIALRFVLPPAAVLSAAGAVALRPAMAWAIRRARSLSRRRLSRDALEALVLLAFLGVGALYGAYKVTERGFPPTDAEGRARYLTRWVRGHQGVEHLNREHGSDYVVYGLHHEQVRYYARGRFLGDWYGPFRFPLVTPLLASPERLEQRLRSWGADHLLVPRELGERWALNALSAAPCPRGSGGFEMVWEDAQVIVYRLVEPGATGSCAENGEGPDR